MNGLTVVSGNAPARQVQAPVSCIPHPVSFALVRQSCVPDMSNEAPPVLILYSTPACHLCETALLLMEPYLDALDLDIEEVDISLSDELVEKYGIRIPVIRFADSDAELGWPFTEDQFLDFVAAR